MDLIVRVRGVGDASLTSVFRPLLAASAAATRQVEADVGKIGKAAARGASEGAAAHKRAGREVEGVYRKLGTAAEEWAKASEKAQDAAHRKALANIRELEREQRAAVARQGREAQRAQSQIPSAALRTFGGLARAGLGLAQEAGAGFGVDFSLQGGLTRGMQRNATAIALSNAAYKEGGPRESVAGLESQAMAAGARYKLDPTGVIEGLAQYQKLTGDLATGKAGLDGLVALAGATTTKLDDMFAAAGNVGNALGEVGAEFKTPEEKARAINDVMRSIAAFGQEGAVEISDLSKQMAKVAASAGFFEGDRGENLKKMTALAQLARMSGGAASATQAATSVLSFANIMRTPARRAQFKEMGIDVDSKTQTGQLRDPIEIIKEALTKTGGAIEPMKKLFANVMGDKPVTALATAYNKAGGGDAGMKAVDAMLAKFGGTMSPGQIAANNAERMKGKEAEGIAFQIELDKVTSALGTELAPALKTLAPLAIDAAKGLAGIVSFGAQNPGLAITAAIVASIGKAAVGEAVGKAMGGMLANMTASSAGLGLLAAAAIAAAIAIADYQAKSDEAKGKASADPELIKKAEEQLRTKGTIDKETIDEIARKRAEVAGAQAALKTGGVEDLSYSQIIAAKATGGADQVAGAEGATRAAKEMGPEKLDALASRLDAILAAYTQNKPPTAEAIGAAVGAAVNRGGGGGPTPNEGARSGGVH